MTAREELRASAGARSEPVPLLHLWKSRSDALASAIHASERRRARPTCRRPPYRYRPKGALRSVQRCSANRRFARPPERCRARRWRARSPGSSASDARWLAERLPRPSRSPRPRWSPGALAWWRSPPAAACSVPTCPRRTGRRAGCRSRTRSPRRPLR